MKTSPKTSRCRPRGGLIHRLAVAFALAFLAALGGATAAASAAKPASAQAPGWPKPWAARFVAPNNHAVVTDGTVEVTAQLAPGVKKFRALVDDSVVTGAFHSAADGHVRKATLKVGETPGLGYGRHVIYVETRGKAGQTWWAQRRVLIARPGTGLVGKASAHRVKGAGVKVDVTTKKPFYQAGLRVDGGKQIDISGDGRKRALHLSADQGLHPGRNLLAVRVLDGKNGRYETRRLKVVLPRDVPVAGAGGPHRAQRGHPVRFDGSGTNAPHGGAAYRWTIVKAPAGSKAKLRKATSAHPVLRPDVVGRYLLKLTTTAPNTPAASASTAGEPTGEPAEVASDSATTTLDASPPHGAIGVPIETIAEGGIKVGEKLYALQHPEDALHLLVLNRSSLAEVSNTSYPLSEIGANDLYDAIHDLAGNDEDLVIITKPDAADKVNDENATANDVNEALEEVGADRIPNAVAAGEASCSTTVPCSAFSAIGVPGSAVGEGTINPGLAGLRGHAAGDLHGYLQEELTGSHLFTYVSSERVFFDTGAESENPAKVTLGSQEAGSPLAPKTYTSEKVEGGGWFVLLLKAGNLEKISENTYPNTASGLEKMHAELAKYEGSKTTLAIVRTVGKVSRVNSPAWDQVASDLQAFGGSSLYVNTLGTTESKNVYAQVGPGGTPGYPSASTQVATGVRTGTGRLTGLLGYNDQGQLSPVESTPLTEEALSHPLAGTLPGLISLPPSAWPEEKWLAPELAAEKCIASFINVLGPLSTPIHKNYSNANTKNSWSAYSTKLQKTSFAELPKSELCTPVTKGAYEEVSGQLIEEWSAISGVYSFFENLNTALDKVDAGDQVESVAEAVNQGIPIPSPGTTKVGFNRTAIASDSLWVASALFPEEDAIANSLNFLAGVLGLAGEIQQGAEGSASEHVSVSASKFAETVATELDSASRNLGRDREIILGDWEKLKTAARNAEGLANAAANWRWEQGQAEDAVDALMVSVRRASYETLFPAAFGLFRLQAGTGTLPTNPAQYACFHEEPFGVKSTWEPFKLIEQYGSVDLYVNGAGAMEDWVYGEPDKSFTTHPYVYVQTPEAKLLKKIFGPAEPLDHYQKAPLFNGEQFAIETYDNGGKNTITITHAKQGKQTQICQAN